MSIDKDEELDIYRSLLINIHTCRWTHNMKGFWELLDKVGAYSYARTNGNGFEGEEERIKEQTLLDLK